VSNVARHRQQLSLRAEKAFGLGAMGVRKRATSLPDETPSAAAPIVESRSAQRGERSPQEAFGNDERASRDIAPSVAPKTTTQTSFGSVEPFASPVLALDAKRVALKTLDDNHVKGCTKCRLSETRTQTVFGEGDPDASIFFIGEGPGENEDLAGRPFVGKAGQLLEKMINAMGLKREQVFIANIVKCRPPGNRAPAPDETSACTPYLVQQIELVRPKVIVTLGLPAARFMLGSTQSMGRLRGNWFAWRGISLMPTFHPSYVLRSYTPEVRAAVWSDLQQVMDKVGLKISNAKPK
jgi:uracil-DNA glycosylase family 4